MNTTAQIKQNIKKSAQQVQAEPLELLREAKKQITGENIQSIDFSGNQNSEQSEKNQSEEELKKQVDQTDDRQLQALQNEIEDIRKQNLFNVLMQRIQSGEDVFLSEFSELTYEQKEVLKAQLEAVKNRNIQQSTENQLIEPQAKKSRRLGGFGQKQAAQRQTTHIEKPLPPSG